MYICVTADNSMALLYGAYIKLKKPQAVHMQSQNLPHL